MAIKFKRHIPNHIDEWSPTHEFENINEILEKDWVKNWSEINFQGVPFWRFSKGKHGESWLLIAEWKTDEAHKWFVVGYLDQDCDLPEFKAKKRNEIMAESRYTTIHYTDGRPSTIDIGGGHHSAEELKDALDWLAEKHIF